MNENEIYEFLDELNKYMLVRKGCGGYMQDRFYFSQDSESLTIDGFIYKKTISDFLKKRNEKKNGVDKNE